ncbi:MAG: DmsC/YnfH family molybdoenzyme membrane anchor subunit [Pseudomonadota bacterium]
MFEPRPKEQPYAFVPKVEHPELNRWGQSIETVPEGHDLRGQSLNINGDAAVSSNPDRYKQHGFYFNADNCIGCHACEAACAEKNETPAHLAFRSVGYLEGGAYPSYTRMNISMACNHCDDPVCLKGCPTLAYTKFAEYGAVLQDPDICFGCGYCTWVCPYNAPQLDPVAGHVSKCNMCVDRLEVGLKPACAAACLGNALDFGVMETKPENRIQAEITIPGFPDPNITHPNIRFQQTKTLPREMTRTDSNPLRYVRTSDNSLPRNAGEGGGGGEYQPQPMLRNEKLGWGLKKLSTRENPLVVFTLISQAVVGAFLVLFFGPLFGLEMLAADAHPIARPAFLFGMIGLQTLALVLSTLHLGRPHRFYRAFNNLRYSPVSREVAGIAVFYNLLGAYTVMSAFPQLGQWLSPAWLSTLTSVSGYGAALSGLAALYFMHKIYRIPARPFWNHWQVLTSFYGSMLMLGPLAVGLVFAPLADDGAVLLGVLAWVVVAGLVLELVGLVFHARDLQRMGGEGAAAHQVQTTNFAYTYRSRNAALGLALLALLSFAVFFPQGTIGLVAWVLISMVAIAAAAVGRMLFYALVIPTTMPGAFFWRNPAFQEHARETGLAKMPQVGVAMDCH